MNQELRLPERGPQCPPAVVLEYLAAGEAIDPAQSAHVGGCSQCSAYVQALSEACSEFQRAHPDELVLRKLARRREATPTRRSWLGGLLAGFAATAALVLAVVLVLPNQGVRHKGGTEFGVYVQRQGESAPAPLASGARVYAGDVLRFHVRAHADGYLMVLEVDGAGRLSVFHPFEERAAAQVSGGRREVLPESIALDASPGPTRIGAVFRPAPFTLDEVRRWLKMPDPSGAPVLEGCSDCTAQWLSLEK